MTGRTNAGPERDREVVAATAAPIPGAAPEAEIAFDIARRGAMITPPVVIGLWLIAGPSVAASVAYGVAVVCANLLLSALLLRWAARISLGLVVSASLGSYLFRLGFVFAAVWLVKDMSWVRLVPLGLALIIAHLGLLAWELRYVSGTFAHPGLKPRTRRPAAGYRGQWPKGSGPAGEQSQNRNR